MPGAYLAAIGAYEYSPYVQTVTGWPQLGETLDIGVTGPPGFGIPVLLPVQGAVAVIRSDKLDNRLCRRRRRRRKRCIALNQLVELNRQIHGIGD